MYKANSPIILTVPVIAPDTLLVAKEIKIDLIFWDGSKGTPPSIFNFNDSYQIIKTNTIAGSSTIPLQQVGNFEFDLADLMKDKISFFLPPSLNSGINIVNNAIWFYHITQYIPFTGNTSFIDSDPALANLGYAYGNEGMNTQTPTNRILLDSTVLYTVSRNGTFNLPLLGFETANADVKVQSLPSGGFNTTYTIPATTIASQITGNIVVNMNDIPIDDTSVEITIYDATGGTETVMYVDIEDECIEVPTDLAFINKEGGLQFLTFFKTKTQTLSVSNESFNSRLGRASDGYHQDSMFNITGKVTTRLNSGFIDESLNRVYKQLLLSSRVWEITVDRKFNPITITTKSFQFKTRLNDKLIKYEIEYENAYNEIQQY